MVQFNRRFEALLLNKVLSQYTRLLKNRQCKEDEMEKPRL